MIDGGLINTVRGDRFSALPPVVTAGGAHTTQAAQPQPQTHLKVTRLIKGITPGFRRESACDLHSRPKRPLVVMNHEGEENSWRV